MNTWLLYFAVLLGFLVFIWAPLGGAVTSHIYRRKGRNASAGLIIGACVGLVSAFLCAFIVFFVLSPGNLLINFVSGLIGPFLPLVPLWLAVETRHKKCPNCGEKILANAMTCPYCKHQFIPAVSAKRSSVRFIEKIPLATLLIAGGIVCILSTLLATFFWDRVVLPKDVTYINPQGNYILAPTATTIYLFPVVIAVQQLPRGIRIPEGALAIQAWPYYAIPQRAITDKSKVVGKYASSDIFIEQPITDDLLSDDYYRFLTGKTGISTPAPTPTPAEGEPTKAPPSPRPEANLFYDQPVAGTIDVSKWQDTWRFQGNADQTIYILMQTTSGELTPFVMVWAEHSEEWVEGKRAFERGQVTFIGTLPKNDMYIVFATRARLYNGTTAGRYCLLLASTGMPDQCLLP